MLSLSAATATTAGISRGRGAAGGGGGKFSCYLTADNSRGIDACASPLCMTYARPFYMPLGGASGGKGRKDEEKGKDEEDSELPSSSLALPPRESLVDEAWDHRLVVGFDDGTVAHYDDRVLGRGAVRVVDGGGRSLHDRQAVRALQAFYGNGCFDDDEGGGEIGGSQGAPPPPRMNEDAATPMNEDGGASPLPPAATAATAATGGRSRRAAVVSASEACRAVMAITTSDSATSSGGSGSSTSAVSAAATAAAEVSQVDLRSDYLVSLATTVLPAPAVEGVAPRKRPALITGGLDGQVRIIQL